MKSTWLNRLLEMLQNLLAGFGVPEASRPVGALIVLYVVATLAVLLFVLIVWWIGRRRKTPEAPETEPRAESHPENRDEIAQEIADAPSESPPDTPEEHVPPVSVLDRMRAGLGKTRNSLVGRLDSLFQGHAGFSRELIEELEEILVTSDFGLPTTMGLIDSLEQRFGGSGASSDAIYAALKEEIARRLKEMDVATPDPDVVDGPLVIMVVGVNGVGKTTTIGKLAGRYRKEGRKVLVGAGDTFRAAAADQLEVWSERAGADIVRHADGGDPAAVAFDAVKAAVARNADVLIFDTAGRLHTKVNLMEELKKVCRVLDRELQGAPHQTLLVVDATTGQNALAQARLFKEAVNVDGIVLTKLDGTAKGGIVIAISNDLGIPVRYIGVGEGLEDLRPFDPDLFVEALFGRRDEA